MKSVTLALQRFVRLNGGLDGVSFSAGFFILTMRRGLALSRAVHGGLQKHDSNLMSGPA